MSEKYLRETGRLIYFLNFPKGYNNIFGNFMGKIADCQEYTDLNNILEDIKKRTKDDS